MAESAKTVKETKAEKKTAIVHFPAPMSKEEPNYVVYGLNGKLFKIKKGEDVEVPADLAEWINEHERIVDEIRMKRLSQ